MEMMSHPLPEKVPQQQQQQQQQERWRCDICRVRTFTSFQAACDHEAQCGGGATQPQSTSSTRNDISVPTHPAMISSSSSTSCGNSSSSFSSALGPIPNSVIPPDVVVAETPTDDSLPATATTTKRIRTKTTIAAVGTTHQATKTTQTKKKKKKETTTPLVQQQQQQQRQTTLFATTLPSTNKHTKKIPQSPFLEAATTTHPEDLSHLTKKTKKKTSITTTSRKVLPKKRSLAVSSSSSSSSQVRSNVMDAWAIPKKTSMRDDPAPMVIDVDEDVVVVDDIPNIILTEEHHYLTNEEILATAQFRQERQRKQQAERDKQHRRRQQQMGSSSSSSLLLLHRHHSNNHHSTDDIDDDDCPADQTVATAPLLDPDATGSTIAEGSFTTTPGTAAVAFLGPPPGTTCTTTTTTNTANDRSLRTRGAIRFPNPSHVIVAPLPPSTTPKTTTTTTIVPPVSQHSSPWWWQQRHSLTPVPPPGRRPSTFGGTMFAQHHHLSSLASKHDGVESFDLLTTVIYASIVPRATNATLAITTSGGDDRDGSCSTRMWVDRYYNTNHLDSTRITDTDTGTSIVPGGVAYDQIRHFIERFMLERQKVERASVEKRNQQRQNWFGQPTSKISRSSSSTTTTKRRTGNRNDIWDDDEEYTNSNSALDAADRWSSLCVISGPIGVGKSNLVHRVAKELGCRKVVELHTGMKRNAASIKRIIEEATKSHSTFDMLQNQCQGISNDKSLEDRGSAVTVILVDEVDHLDPDTDCGFWSALCDLSKESKCPIMVTCNSVPKELKASSFRWTHVPIERPTAVQCAGQLRDILWQEGYTVRDAPHHGDAEPRDALVTMAKLVNCDMRRILHELQLFHAEMAAKGSHRSDDGKLLLPHVNVPHQDIQPFLFPTIESVFPNVIFFDRNTCITVNGTNFLSLIDPTQTKNPYHCKVYIGSYCCAQARIMNDSTILAVVTPSDNVTNSYLPVNIASRKGLGIMSSTKGSLMKMELPDQTKILSTVSACLVECRPGQTVHKNDSDSECEFEADVTREVVSEKLLEHVSSFDKMTNKHLETDLAMKMLNDSVDTHRAMYEVEDVQETIATPFSKVNEEDLDQFEELVTLAGLASDASLFEDVGLNPVPILSGACRGFGFVHTEDFPKRTNEHSKPPSEEQLYLSGWKDNASFFGTSDCQMTRCLSKKERKLLRWYEPSIRGCSLQYSGNLDEDEADQYREFASELSDEDYLLSIIVPNPLFDLPQFLSPQNKGLPQTLQYEFYKQQQKMIHAETWLLLRDSIFTNPKYIRYSRRLDLPFDDANDFATDVTMLDSDIILDYLPLLRNMAVQEQVSEFTYKALKASNNDPATRRRTTRQSIKLGREQYFDKIVPSYTWQESNRSSKDVVDRLADMSLLCLQSVNCREYL